MHSWLSLVFCQRLNFFSGHFHILLEVQIDSVCLVLSQGQLKSAKGGVERRRGFNKTLNVIETIASAAFNYFPHRQSIHNVSATFAFVLLIGHNSSWLVSSFK